MTASSLLRFRPIGISILSFPPWTFCCRRGLQTYYGVLTITDKRMTRFMISPGVDESSNNGRENRILGFRAAEKRCVLGAKSDF